MLPPLLRFRALPGLAALLVAILPAPAQIPGPPTEFEAFQQLRSQFHTQALLQSQKLTEQYERALARLEADVADHGDYEQALEIQKRRDQLLSLYAGSDPALVEKAATPLPASDARGTGISLLGTDTLTGWRSASHFAEWSNVRLTPGDYFLELDYLMLEAPQLSSTDTVSADPRATMEFFEVSLLAGAADNRRGFELVLARSSTTTPTSLRIGPIRYTRSPVTLRLSPERSYPSNIIRIQNLRLVPAAAQPLAASTASAAGTTPAPAAGDLPAIRETLSSELTQAYEPILTSQIKQLQDLAQQKPDWRSHIEAEVRTLQRRLEKPEKKDGLNLPKPIASLGGISGFQEWEQVAFSPHPDNTGDRFCVRYQNQDVFVRLLWLRCAPPVETGESASESLFSRQFQIAPEDAALFGRAAREFTAGYLEGKTLRLLARASPDPDGTTPALVFLDDIGLFHHVLIDQGLATVVGKAGTGGTLERALLRSLLDREADCRRREPRPGAWALSPLPPTP